VASGRDRRGLAFLGLVVDEVRIAGQAVRSSDFLPEFAANPVNGIMRGSCIPPCMFIQVMA